MKTARFYCESCGRAVAFDAEMCPNCGKRFDAVKCPVCNHTGMAGQFLKGCPECGYLADEGSSAGGFTGSSRAGSRSIRDEELFSEMPKSKGLPTWTYTILLILLVGVLVAMTTLLLM